MLLQCFTWIAHLLDTVSIGPFSFSLKKVVVSELSDDVIVDILSRLPAECVLDCQRVCKRWRSLTLSEYFIKLHLSRATLAIFVHDWDYVRKGKQELGFFVYDPTIAKRKKMKKLRLKPEIVMNINFTMLYDSCGGLLLFADRRNHWCCYVFNPVRQEQIFINCPSPGYLCGFFSHPLTNEYRILYLHFPRHGRNQYFVYTLGGSSIWRKINSPPFHYAPSNIAPPAICNGALHWLTSWDYTRPKDVPPCACGIIVFAMDTEDFVTLPHPGNECFHVTNHGRMQLKAANEVLSFCLWDGYGKQIDIWILEEYATWEWVRKWKVNLNLLFESLGENYNRRFLKVQLIHIEDGQLWLECCENGLFLYQLEHNSITKLEGQPWGDTASRLICSAFTRSLLCLHQLGSPPLE